LTLPRPHAEFLRTAIGRLEADARLVGAGAGGSFQTASMDAFSDLDLIVAVEPAAYEAVLKERLHIARGLGPLLGAFTGEHVGEPRLLICLFGPPLLHVDLKFVSLADLADRVEDPAILWERDGRLGSALERSRARYPQPDPQWIEDRFWIWIHYAAAKIGRGEIFEAIGFLGFLRSTVLGPLILAGFGARPDGVRKIERLAPEPAQELRETVAAYDPQSCASALRSCVRIYRHLRGRGSGDALRINDGAEAAAMAYLDETEARLGA
jgi:hypothetical protein